MSILVFTKMLIFWVIFMTGEYGNIGTPPPLWEFFPRGQTPPIPPVWERPCHKKILRFILCFRASWAFLVFTKMLTFWVVFMTGECGNIGTPPLCGKISHVISFFSDEWHARLVLGPFNQYQVTQIDQISLPPYCKTCFSTSGWFWHAKKTC